MVGVDITAVAMEWAGKNRDANPWMADLLTVGSSCDAAAQGSAAAGVPATSCPAAEWKTHLNGGAGQSSDAPTQCLCYRPDMVCSWLVLLLLKERLELIVTQVCQPTSARLSSQAPGAQLWACLGCSSACSSKPR